MITATQPRDTVQVRFPDSISFDGPRGTSLEQFVETAKLDTDGVIVGALVNGKLRELTYLVHQDCAVVPISTRQTEGMRIYKRSLSFLMIVAAQKCYPDRTLKIQHSMPFGGYYIESDIPFSKDDLVQLNSSMVALVSEDLPLKSVEVPLAEALTYFRENGDLEKAELFAKRRKDHLKLYELAGMRDYFHGFMVPSTGYLKQFALHPYADGFILQFPRRREPEQLQPFQDAAWLTDIFHSYAEWLHLIGVPSVASLNNASEVGRLKEVILIAEALHSRQLADIADEIGQRKNRTKVVLISGPSSAGKTTFSKRLAVQLLARGIRPVAIGMDNYFRDRADTPRDKQGDYDFEHIDAVDVPLFREHLKKLLAGETITQPVYNFYTGMREQGEPLTLRPDQMLIIEGIHGLNPALVEGIDPDAIFRVFISAFTQLNLDKHNRIATTDTRKLRRMVRDYYHRGYSAADTLQRWPKVRRGEKNWIFPYQRHADVFFNSALVYELAAIKPIAEPILLQVEPDTPERIEANRLRAFLQWFDPIDDATRASIPSDSILREFIGGSIMDDFEPWIE